MISRSDFRVRIDPAWLLWLVVFCALTGNLILHPGKHNNTAPSRLASIHWWAGQDMYSMPANSGAAFFYLPQAAILYTPFAFGPYLLGEVLERAFGFCLFGAAIYRLAQFFRPQNGPALSRQFPWISLLAIPASFASLHNGQPDLPLTALILLTAAEVNEERWNWATFWLCLGLALKPLMLVPLLLFGALYRPLWLRLALGFCLVLLLPFLRWNWPYVLWQYQRFAETLQWAYQLREHRFSDLGALLGTFGLCPPNIVLTGLRALCAPTFLYLGWQARRNLAPAEAAWYIAALSAVYLILFNPRTETCSFVLVGPYLASLSIYLARQHRLLAVALAAGCIGLASDAFPTVVYKATNPWLKPLLTLLFLQVLFYFLVRTHPQSR